LSNASIRKATCNASSRFDGSLSITRSRNDLSAMASMKASFATASDTSLVGPG
jgi:hypothetical protein